jgi:hypothetical protein
MDGLISYNTKELSIIAILPRLSLLLQKKMKHLLHLFYRFISIFLCQYRCTTRYKNRFGSPITPDASLLFFSASDL